VSRGSGPLGLGRAFESLELEAARLRSLDYVESLILAQDERWRRALPMQVGRQRRELLQWQTAE
jgi:hypothetical protein